MYKRQDENLTVFQTIDDVAKGEIRNKIRDLLGAFMFGGPEEYMKKVKALSGGERTRLAMIKLLLDPVNLLILDEPTNHLDMKTKDILKQDVYKRQPLSKPASLQIFFIILFRTSTILLFLHSSSAVSYTHLISVINLYLPVMAVTEFQAFGTGR